MSFSVQKLVSDGTLTDVLLAIKYIYQEDIRVLLDGTLAVQDVDYTWVNPQLIRLTAPAPAGAVVQVVRRTTAAEVLNKFTGGAVFNNLSMDENFSQLLYVAQESVEGANLTALFQDVDAQGNTFVNLRDATGDSSPVTLRQLQSAVLGFEFPPAVYTSGLIVTRPTQLVQREGKLYSVRPSESFPVTLSGDWGADQVRLVVRSEVGLRQELALPTGSASIGHEGGTVKDALDALELVTDDQGDSIAAIDVDIINIKNNLDQIESRANKGFNSANGNIVAGGFAPVRCVNILGDSISYGANAQNIQRDSWAGIFGKMLNLEFGTQNLGWLSVIASTSNAEGTYLNYHTQTGQTGTWTSVVGADAGHIPSGYAIQSTVAASTLVYRVPLSQRYLRVWYDGTVTGEIEIVINSAVVQTLVTDGTGTGYERGAALEMATLAASNNGLCTFTVRCKSGTVRITGFEFANDTTGNFRLNNFSRDGRAGRYVSQDVINKACAGCYFMVWALGVNDVPGGEAAVLEYTQRIDWLIAAATANKTRVVLIDFMYNQPENHPLREQLRRASREIPGSVIVDAAKVWAVNGVQLTVAEIVSRNLAAGVHPEEPGHRIIAEVVAQRIGLSVTSKREATRRNPMWNAFDISASGLENSSAVPGSITGWRISERAIELVVNITTVPTASVTLGTVPATEMPGGGFTALNIKSNPDINGRTGLFTLTAGGALSYRPDPSSGAPTATAAQPPASVQLYASIPFNDTALWL